MRPSKRLRVNAPKPMGHKNVTAPIRKEQRHLDRISAHKTQTHHKPIPSKGWNHKSVHNILCMIGPINRE